MSKEPLQRYFHVVPELPWHTKGPQCGHCEKIITDDEMINMISDINEASQYHPWCWDELEKGVRWSCYDGVLKITNPDYKFRVEEAGGKRTMFDLSGDASKQSGTVGLPDTDSRSLPKLGGNTTWTSWRYRCIQRIRDRIGKSRNEL